MHPNGVFALEHCPCLLGLVVGLVLGDDRHNIHLHQHRRLHHDNSAGRMAYVESRLQETREKETVS